LPINIEANRSFAGIEFVLLDYSSPDGLSEWVKTAIPNEITSGRVAYYKIDNQKHFRHAHAKNVAHRLACAPIVCNLDADNFSGVGFAEFLHNTFTHSSGVFLHSHGVPGAYGRLAFMKADFELLGGYDEDLRYGWGYEDNDLKLRAKAFGLHPIVLRPSSQFLCFLEHSDVERTAFAPLRQKMRSRRLNQRISKLHLFNGVLTANLGRKWGSAVVRKNFGEIIEL